MKNIIITREFMPYYLEITIVNDVDGIDVITKVRNLKALVEVAFEFGLQNEIFGNDYQFKEDTECKE